MRGPTGENAEFWCSEVDESREALQCALLAPAVVGIGVRRIMHSGRDGRRRRYNTFFTGPRVFFSRSPTSSSNRARVSGSLRSTPSARLSISTRTCAEEQQSRSAQHLRHLVSARPD